MGALRREALAMQQLDRLQAELAAGQDLLKQRDMDAQRSKMIVKLKETHIARLQVRLPPPSPYKKSSTTLSLLHCYKMLTKLPDRQA